MDFRKLEKALFEDEGFLKFLEKKCEKRLKKVR
jgi:hypothetical protein